MLPFPIFLFLLISATLLAPPPVVWVGSLNILALRSFEWSSLYTSIPDPDPDPNFPPENTPLFSLGMPSVTLDPSPTQCFQNSMLMANNTVPHSSVRATEDRTSFIAVLLVLSLLMVNYVAYRLLVDESGKSPDAEKTSEQFTSPLSNPATPPQEFMHYCISTVEETPHPFALVDTAKFVSESLEHGSLPYSTNSPSASSFTTTVPHQSPAPSGESLFFPIISHGFSLGSSEKTTDNDSCSSTLPASSCAFVGPSSVSATQTAAFEATSALSVEPVVWIDDLEVELPECTPLNTEAAKVATSPHLDLSSVSNPRNPEPSGELHDDSILSPAIEDAGELDADEEDVFCYQSSNSEGDGNETLEYKEVDSTPEAPNTPLTPATEDLVLPSPQPRLRSRGHSLDYGSSFSVKRSASEIVNIHFPSPRFLFLLDYTSEGQSKGEITSITRCVSADNLVCPFEPFNAAHGSHSSPELPASIITDCPSPTFRDTFDDVAYDQVATLSSLRADAPIFKPRTGSPEMNQAVSLEPVSVGLEASIHAPRDEEISQMQGRVEVLNATINTPGRPVESGSFRTYIDVVEEPESSGNAQSINSVSPRVSDGLRASIHAPPDSSTGALQALGDDTANLEKELTHSMAGSNSTRSGLYASIHAPEAGQSGQSERRSSKHHTDVPNWAAICRAEKSSTEGSLPAKCGINSPLSAAAALDEGASGPSTATTTRCAASNQEGTSVDDSDGSSLVHSSDDQEGTIISSGGTDSIPGELDVHDEEQLEDPTGTKPPRKPRRRGGRRSRKKIPYVPPPRMMQNLSVPVTQQQQQHPVTDVRAQGPDQAPNASAAPAPLSGYHHYTHAPATPPHYPISAPGPMIPPNGIIHDQFGFPHYYPSSPGPHVVPIPSFHPPPPPPGPHNPWLYPIGPHPHVSPHPPSTLLYGR